MRQNKPTVSSPYKITPLTVIKKGTMVTAQNDVNHRKVTQNTTEFKKLPPCMPQLKSDATMKEVDSDSLEDLFLPLLQEKKQKDLKHGRTSGDTKQDGTFQKGLLGSDTLTHEGTSNCEQTVIGEGVSWSAS